MAHRGPNRDGMSSRSLGQRVLDRDGWTCQMPRCLAEEPEWRESNGGRGRGISKDLTGTGHIWAASIDHIIPRSMGGRSVMTNLRAAHRKCNSVASGKPLGLLIPPDRPRGPWGGLLTGTERSGPPRNRRERIEADWAAQVLESRRKEMMKMQLNGRCAHCGLLIFKRDWGTGPWDLWDIAAIEAGHRLGIPGMLCLANSDTAEHELHEEAESA